MLGPVHNSLTRARQNHLTCARSDSLAHTGPFMCLHPLNFALGWLAKHLLRCNGPRLLYLLPSGVSQKVCYVGTASSKFCRRVLGLLRWNGPFLHKILQSGGSLKMCYIGIGMVPASSKCCPRVSHTRFAMLEWPLPPLNVTRECYAVRARCKDFYVCDKFRQA